ncbi:MAG: hypothetical protein LBG52_05800 [Candidatus Peribacteria bacterium]|jgi:hypothetical protein|nr:hypothetical protein [Candidatus Peribacteria bacterium]
MENLDLNKFNPTVAELTSLAEKYREIEIQGIEDKEGLARCKEARIDLRTKRTTLEKIGKGLRQDAIDFQKAVIAKEKELIGIIEPLEKELKEKEDEIERLKILAERKKILPERVAEYEALGTGNTMVEEMIMSYDDEGRRIFILELKAKILEEKERKLKEEQEKMEAEKREMEAKKAEEERIQKFEQEKKEAEEKARLETEERLKREAEEKERKERMEAEEKARKEKEEAERKELEAKKAEEERQKAEEERQKNKKYQAFIASIEWNENEDIKIERN